MDTGIKLEVHLCEKEPVTQEILGEGSKVPYLVSTNSKDESSIVILSHYYSFPATLRVKASYEATIVLMYGWVHNICAKSIWSEKEILLAVFSIINESYLSYTEQLIMEAGKSEAPEETLS